MADTVSFAAIDDALKNVKAMPSVGDAEVMRAFLLVPVECTKLIAERIRAYDETTAGLTRRLLWTNWALVGATVAGALAAWLALRK
jgi:hypothetical protein